MQDRWIDRPAKTRPAQLRFNDTPWTGITERDGTVRHDFMVSLPEPRVIDASFDGYAGADRVYEVNTEWAGNWGTIASFGVVEATDGTMTAKGWIQGGQPGGRRYITHRGPDALHEAKAHVKRWAGRRFRVAKEG